MQRILNYILFICIAFTSCEEDNHTKSRKELLDAMEEDYIRKINDLDIYELYNEVKFRLYCNHCDQVVKDCMGHEVEGLTYGMLALKVFYLNYDEGKGELAYTFIYNDSLQCSLESAPRNQIHGIGFEEGGKAPLYYIVAGKDKKVSIRCDTMEDISDCPTRMINPKQPVVIKYLERNRGRINPWFHMEAMKRGFIKEEQ